MESEVPKEKLVACVLVGRPKLAVETIQQLLRMSPLLRGVPLYAFHFPGSLTKPQERAISQISDNVHVLETTLVLPRFKPSEMFYSRSNSYAREFPRGRIGYLDMCFWRSNFFSEPKLMKFEYLLTFDDDSVFSGSPDHYLSRAMEDPDWVIASAGTYNHVSQNGLDTRENLFSFTKAFVDNHLAVIPDAGLRDAIALDDEARFHRMSWSVGNFNLYRLEAFQTPEWFRWIYAVNLYGGAHRFRWGDIETLGTYCRAHFSNHLLNLGMIENGDYKPRSQKAEVVLSAFGRFWAALRWKLSI